MPENGFFQTFNPAQAVKEVTSLALQKYQLDEAANRFNQEMGIKKQQLGMAAESHALQVDALKRKNQTEAEVKETLRSMMQPTTTTGPSATDLETSAGINAAAPEGGSRIDPSLIPTMTRTAAPKYTAEDLIRKVAGITGDTADLKALADVEKRDRPVASFATYIDPNDPTKSATIVEGRDNPPQGMIPLKAYEALKKGGGTGTPSSNSVTERGGLPIWKDPRTQKTEVVHPDGTRETYDPKVHGKELSQSQSQTVIYTQEQKKEHEKKVDARVKKIGDAIISGKQLPEISGFGMAEIAAPLKEYLADQKFDLTSAMLDYIATKKFVQTMNGAQQLRLGQAIRFTKDSLAIVRDLGKEWKEAAITNGTAVPLNSAELALARNGAYGKKAASVATRLEAQINDLTSELGTVYKGGNSSTDESLKLAAGNLKAKWDESVLNDNIDQIEKNLAIRDNSMKLSAPAAMSAASVYKKPAMAAENSGSSWEALKKKKGW